MYGPQSIRQDKTDKSFNAGQLQSQRTVRLRMSTKRGTFLDIELEGFPLNLTTH